MVEKNVAEILVFVDEMGSIAVVIAVDPPLRNMLQRETGGCWVWRRNGTRPAKVEWVNNTASCC